MSTLKAEDFLTWEANSRDSIDVKRIYIDITGYDLETGVFHRGDHIIGSLLSQIIFYFLRSHKDHQIRARVKKNGKIWTVIKREAWWEECRISIKQADRGLARLSALGIIETGVWKFNGDPTTHITLNTPRLVELMNLFNECTFPVDEGGFPLLPFGEEPGCSPKGNNDVDVKGVSLTETATETPTESIKEEVTSNSNRENAFFQKGGERKKATAPVAVPAPLLEPPPPRPDQVVLTPSVPGLTLVKGVAAAPPPRLRSINEPPPSPPPPQVAGFSSLKSLASDVLTRLSQLKPDPHRPPYQEPPRREYFIKPTDRPARPPAKDIVAGWEADIRQQAEEARQIREGKKL